MAKTVSGADDVELKATIPHKQIHWGLRRYNLTTANDEERHIYFFDTPDLELFHSGVVLRARRIIGGQHDSTVKFRPVEPSKVPAKWKRYVGFKIERPIEPGKKDVLVAKMRYADESTIALAHLETTTCTDGTSWKRP